MSFFDDKFLEQADKDNKKDSAFNTLFANSNNDESSNSSADESEQNLYSSSDNPFISLMNQDGSEESNNFTDGQEQSVSKKVNLNKLYSPGSLLVILLKGYIDREDDKTAYESLIRHEYAVRELCTQLYLKLVIDDSAGYAFVKTLSDEEVPPSAIGLRGPNLLIKRQFSLYSSLVLILLRQRLLEFELSGQFGRLVLERQDIIDLVMVYLTKVNNERLVEDRINKAIDDLINLGILAKSKYESAKTKIERIEVKRIINALVTPEVLAQADEMLVAYIAHIRGNSDKSKTRSSTVESVENNDSSNDK